MSREFKIQEPYLKELIDLVSKSLVGKALKRFEILEHKDAIKASVRELIYEEFRQFRDLLIAHNMGLEVSTFQFKSKKKGEPPTQKD